MTDETPVKTRISYAAGRVSTSELYNMGEWELPVVHRTDYHDDGSQSEYYYLELSEEDYNLLAAKAQP